MSDYAYLTTTGRNSREPRTIEIWFGEVDGQLYLLSGGGDRSDWMKNLKRDPAVKYHGWTEGEELSRWAQTALPIAIDRQPAG